MLIVFSALITGKLGACRLRCEQVFCKNPVAFRSTVQSMLGNIFTHIFHHNDKVVEEVCVTSNSGKCSIAFIFHFLVFTIRKIQQRRWFVTFTRVPSCLVHHEILSALGSEGTKIATKLGAIPHSWFLCRLTPSRYLCRLLHIEMRAFKWLILVWNNSDSHCQTS